MSRRALPLALVALSCSSPGPTLELAGSGTAATAARSDHTHDAYLPKGATLACPAGNVVSGLEANGSVKCTPAVGGATVTAGTGIKVEAGAVSLDTAYTDARYAGGRLESDGVTTMYARTQERWVLRASYDAAHAEVSTASRSVPLDSARLASYCGDEDGCTVTLEMRNFDAQASNQIAASIGPRHFTYNPTNGAWRPDAGIAGAGTAVSTGGQDGNDTPENLLQAWNCYFTDALWAAGGLDGTDAPNSGFALLNYNGDTAWKPLCQLVIDD